MWEMIIDLVSVLVITVGYCLYNRNELYGGIDDPQA